MSYLIVVVIGVVAAFVAGKTMKASEDGIGIDLLAGGVGAVVIVLVARMIATGASGLVMSAVIAIVGGVGSLFAMRAIMKARQVPAPRARRR